MNTSRLAFATLVLGLFHCGSDDTPIDGTNTASSSGGSTSGGSSSSGGGSSGGGSSSSSSSGGSSSGGSSSGGSATCTDGMRNGTETDVDCGGTCGKCVVGKTCTQDANCATGNCMKGVCAAPSVAQVSAGYDSACALSTDGRVKCWGRNFYGQLGNGELGNGVDKPLPGAPLAFGAGRSATSIVVGRQTACAIVDNGSLMCWGAGPQFSLPNSITVPTVMNIGAGRTARAVSAHDYIIRVVLDDGTVTHLGSGIPRPLMVGAGRKAISVAAGNQFACLIQDDSSVLCTASTNTSGLLGIGSTAQPAAPTPAVLGTGRTARSISAGYRHACAVLDDNSIKCWGRSDLERSRTGLPQISEPTPTTMALPAGRSAQQVVSAREHSCALLDNGMVTCWGDDSAGQLGEGAGGQHKRTPNGAMVQFGGHTVRSLSSFETFTCALLDDRSVMCWGYGALGFGASAELGADAPSTPVALGF